MLHKFLVASLLVGLSLSAVGVDLSTLTSEANFKCLKDNHGVSFVVMRGYRSFGSVDPNVIDVIKNAHAAGISNVNPYMFPCRSKSASTQVTELVDHLKGMTYSEIWLDIETNTSPGCSWASFSHDTNCKYVEDLVAAVKAAGKTPGIYASAYMWTTIMGSTSACKTLNTHPLWYAHYDGKQTFTDYTEFGGWTKPTIKQYQGTSTWCSTGVDLNWHP